MFGYIIELCKKNKYNLTIYTETKDNFGFLDFYVKITQYISICSKFELKDKTYYIFS